ncbi:serine hydrolase [Acetobacteraceae bacterium]|nr:serine hydrolase [Candidatus Parcubacteria bacterium]
MEHMLENVRGWGHGMLWTVLWLLIGIVATIIYFHTRTTSHQACFAEYPLTSQLLDCDESLNTSARLSDLENTLQAAAPEYKRQGKANRISIWVRDLKTLHWAAVDEFETYAPASLFKVPLMITYFSIAQVDPSILSIPLTYEKNDILNSNSQNVVPQSKLVVGQTYTVEALIEHMIVESDNDATALLLTHVDQDVYANTLLELGLTIPQDADVLDFVTVKTYANVYRTLYYASYLNRVYSQKALDLLSKTTFSGIREVLPPSVSVAHKFGERELMSDGNTQTYEFHDCGIVYKKNRPYSLCIMTEGMNTKDLLSAIQEISKLTYDSL